MWQNKTKSRAGRPRATIRTKDNSNSHQLVWQNVIFWPSTQPQKMLFQGNTPEGSDTFQRPVIERDRVGGLKLMISEKVKVPFCHYSHAPEDSWSGPQHQENKTQRDGHNSGVKIWSLCSVSSILSHANLSNPCNKVRGKMLLKKFPASLSLCCCGWLYNKKADCSERHCTTEPKSWKKVLTSAVRRRLSKAGLYGRIAVKKLLLRKQNNVKRCTKTGQQSSGIKSFGLTNQSSKSLGQIGGSMCGEELVKELKPPVSHQL